ncbi:hypothetical protein TNCV_4445321 [Trichonephila clavipes]|nr:hypothetical protein TNCV_4445321 [Trichonephila clavipes]
MHSRIHLPTLILVPGSGLPLFLATALEKFMYEPKSDRKQEQWRWQLQRKGEMLHEGYWQQTRNYEPQPSDKNDAPPPICKLPYCANMRIWRASSPLKGRTHDDKKQYWS